MDKVKQYLEIATNVAVILAVVGVGWLLYKNRTTAQPMAPAVGTALPALPGYSWDSHGETLVLAMRNGCYFCEESMPLYRQLVKMADSGRIAPHLIAVLPDNPEIASNLLRTQKLDIDHIPAFNLSLLKIGGTPALLLVNAQGKVEHVWMGKLQDAEQSTLLQEIAR